MFKLEINTDGAAFRDEDGNLDMYGDEVRRILINLANTIESCSCHSGNVMDINGNKVGSWSLEE